VTPEETKYGIIKPSLPLESESSSGVVSRWRMTDGMIWGDRHFSRRFLAFLPRSSYDIFIGRLTPLALIAVHDK
jgi:hypothetical protein